MEKIKEYFKGLSMDLKFIFLKRPWWTILCLVMTAMWLPLMVYQLIMGKPRK